MAMNGLRYVSGEYATQSDLTTAGGLIPVNPTSIANSGGTAALSDNLITYTGVSSISVNGCFSATYTNYLFINTGTMSVATNYYMRLRVAGSDASTGAYFYAQAGYNSGNTTSNNSGASQTSIDLYGNPTVLHTIVMSNPFVATPTRAVNQFAAFSASLSAGAGGFFHNVSTSYDGFTMFPASGNITGVVRVYGIKD
jgi:hypothetical protein